MNRIQRLLLTVVAASTLSPTIAAAANSPHRGTHAVFTVESATQLPNEDVSLAIRLDRPAGNMHAGVIDLLISYDPKALTLLGVRAGDALVKRKWEFFQYRIESVHPHTVRIVAKAEGNPAPPHPKQSTPDGVIAWLDFHTTNNRVYSCSTEAVRFVWKTCGDNTITTRDASTIYIVDNSVIDFDETRIFGQTPDPNGYNASVVTAGCPGDTYVIQQRLAFHNGYIKVICPSECDDCNNGDINLNGLGYEIADAILFMKYLVFGQSVLDPLYHEAQAAASDVKGGNTPWGIDDLTYFIRIITGDAPPLTDRFGRLIDTGYIGDIQVDSEPVGSSYAVASRSDHDIGGALLVFHYFGTEITSVTLGSGADQMDIIYNATEGELRILVNDIGTGFIPAGAQDLLYISTTGGGSLNLTSVEAATYLSRRLQWTGTRTAISQGTIQPAAFRLLQNYPNPFNPSTTLAADFPAPSDYSLTIYNIAGQAVRHFTGTASAGRLEITWDGRNHAGRSVGSGIYFYRLRAGDYEAVRKMILMK